MYISQLHILGFCHIHYDIEQNIATQVRISRRRMI